MGLPVNDNEFYIFDEGSSIDHSYALSSDPNGGIPKISSRNNITGNQGSFFDTELLAALQYYFDGKNEAAIEIFKKIFEENKEKAKGKYALTMLKECLRRVDKKEEFINYLNQEVLANLSGKEELYATALELKNQWLLEKGNYNEVISNLNTLKSSFEKNENTLKYALFNLGYVYHTNMNDESNAKKYFSELEEKYPNDPLVVDGKILLDELEGLPEAPKVVEEGKKEIQTNSGNQLSTKYELLSNYPNPFNPTTSITYQIPEVMQDEALSVSLKVYDILGREVVTLVEGPHQPGTYNITFDGSRFSGGVYFCKLQAGKFVQVNKMLLAK